MKRFLFVLVPLALIAAGCGPSVPASPRSSPSASPPAGSSAPPATAGCVSDAMARQVWTEINDRLNAIVLDPSHAGVSGVVTGRALTEVQQYITDTLVAKHLTEREVDTLDSLSVDSAGCNGGPLVVTVRVTLSRDDYLRPDGTVDHSDPAVGTQSHLRETYQRSGQSWKQSSVVDLDAPSPSAQIV